MSVTCNLLHLHLPESLELCTVENIAHLSFNVNNLHSFQEQAVYPKLHGFFLLLGICLDEMLQTARRDGNVLIVVDTAGRVLELSQLLVRHKNVYR